jgi:hypothetical protein
MAMIVHIINPVLPLDVSAEGLCVSERLLFSVNALSGRVTFHLIENPMCQHDLGEVVRVPATMNVKQRPPLILNERLDRAQSLPFHVFINLVTGDLVWPVPAFLDKKLAKYSVGMKSRYARRDAESAVPLYNLPRPMNWLRHVVE